MSDQRFKWTEESRVAEFPVNGRVLAVKLESFGDAVAIDRALQKVFAEGQVAGLRSAKGFINPALAQLPMPVEAE